MKFTNEGDKILNYTKSYINDIYRTTEKFKIFCEDIAKANPCTVAEQEYKNIYNHLNDTVNILATIKDIYFNIKRIYDDKNRPNVLFPYENQAIYQYLSKPDSSCKFLKKFGCIYAEKILVDNKEVITIGLSICNDKDEFSKKIALNLARKRAREYPIRYDIRVTPRPETFPVNIIRIPYKWMYENEIAKFIKRCNRWFKEETIIYPNNIDFVEFPKKKKKKSDKIINEPMPF